MVLTLFGGCGGESPEPEADSTTSSSPEASTSSSTAPSESASESESAEEWVTVRDTSGVTFALSGAVDPTTTTQALPNGQEVDLRLYQVADDDVQLVITVGDGHDFSDYDARLVYRGMAQTLTQSPAKQVELTGLGPISSAAGKGAGATLTFQATDGSLNYWRLATFTTDNVLVTVHALTFVSELNKAARTAVDDRFDRLVKSLDTP